MIAVRRLLVTAVALSLLAPTAALASGADVIKDCTDDGRLSKKYSQKEYSSALGDIPTDVDEYTDCRDVIRRAQLGDTSGTGSGSSGAAGAVGGAPGGPGGPAGGAGAGDPLAGATPQERAAIEKARSGGNKPVKIAGRLVQPGHLGFSGLDAIDTLPTPLLIVLIVAALAAGGAGGALLQRRVLARRAV